MKHMLTGRWILTLLLLLPLLRAEVEGEPIEEPPAPAEVAPEAAPVTEVSETAADLPAAETAPPPPPAQDDGDGRHRLFRDWGENPRVFVIPIDQPIMPPQLFVVRRGVRRALDEGVDAIVFTMDTPGGRVDIMRNVVNMIIDVDVPTFTLVKSEAISAGAIIALATDHVFMRPMSTIGNAIPILSGPGGGMQELGEAEREKIEGYMDAIVRSIAQAKGRDERMISAMVRRDLEYVLEDGRVISEKGRILVLTNQEAEQLKPNGEPLLSEGTVDTLEEMLALIGLGDAKILTEESTWADTLAMWITRISPLLITLALVLFYLEINSPGIGWFGGLAVTFFVIVLFGHNIAGLAGYEDILLILLGLVLLIVEIFVIPGFGLVGITGIFVMIWGFIQAMTIRYPGNPGDLPAFDNIGNLSAAVTNLSLSVSISIVIGAFLLRRFDQSRFVQQNLTLSQAISGRAGDQHDNDITGTRGITLTALTPSGSIELNGREYGAISDAGVIEANTPIRVIEAKGNRILVIPVRNEEITV